MQLLFGNSFIPGPSPALFTSHRVFYRISRYKYCVIGCLWLFSLVVTEFQYRLNFINRMLSKGLTVSTRLHHSLTSEYSYLVNFCYSLFQPEVTWLKWLPSSTLLPHKVDTKNRASLIRSRELQQAFTWVTASWNDYDGDGFTLGCSCILILSSVDINIAAGKFKSWIIYIVSPASHWDSLLSAVWPHKTVRIHGWRCFSYILPNAS